jgi:hypothetical protein
MSNQKPECPSEFDLADGYACFHPTGEVSINEAVTLITNAIIYCRENGLSRLLVDVTQLYGFPSPSVADRYWIARGFAADAKTLVTVSFALPQYLLDPERFGVTVATNMGMRTNAFDSREHAVAWLLSQPPCRSQ